MPKYDDVIAVNLKSAFLTSRAAARPMMRGRFGRIINIGSVTGVMGNPGQCNYAAAKAGLTGLTKSLAKECAADGILVNAIAPGSIDTPMLDSFGPDARQHYEDATLLKRQGAPSELADAVLFLVSEASTYITGSTLHVNGGSLLV